MCWAVTKGLVGGCIYIYITLWIIYTYFCNILLASATFTRDYNIIRFWNPSIERCCHLMSVPPMVFKLTQCNLKMAIAIYTSHYIHMPIFLGLSGESPFFFLVFLHCCFFLFRKPVIWQWSWWNFTICTISEHIFTVDLSTELWMCFRCRQYRTQNA